MKILYFGDIIGKTGRAGVKKILPQLLEQHQPDVVLANAENIAHGTGITPRTIDEMKSAGIQFFTSGNHVWDKPLGEELLQAKDPLVIRPQNYGPSKSGTGVKEIQIGEEQLLLINIQGQVFMHDEVADPFTTIDAIFEQYPPKNYQAIFVDFHGEATAEKRAFAQYINGRASMIVGSHTHIPTADIRILEKGTGYITDAGMNGARNSVIGFSYDTVLGRFLGEKKGRLEVEEQGPCDINAVLVEVTPDRKASKVELLQFTVEL